MRDTFKIFCQDIILKVNLVLGRIFKRSDQRLINIRNRQIKLEFNDSIMPLNMTSDNYLERCMRGHRHSSVAVVFNNSPVNIGDMGAEIDRCELIIRINFGSYIEFPEQFGSRTDLRILGSGFVYGGPLWPKRIQRGL